MAVVFRMFVNLSQSAFLKFHCFTGCVNVKLMVVDVSMSDGRC